MGFRKIKGYDNYYVNEDGVVKNKKGLILKQQESNNGYMRVSLSSHQVKTKHLVHRLVAQAFVKNPNKKLYNQVNHIDENKKNNNKDNLEWCTCSMNLRYSGVILKGNAAHRHKVRCITTGEIFNSIKEVEDKYGVNHSNICACCGKRRLLCDGKEWEYVD